jgi:signal transduction histidine kinase
MKSVDANYLNVGPRLMVTFSVLIVLILGGNGLLIWQFRIASLQTERLTRVSRQLITVQRLQEQLLIFHQRLDEIAQSKDAHRLVTEAEPLLKSLLEQTQQTRKTLTRLPSEIPVDPLEAIEVTLPSQLEGITALSKSGDWEAVNLRLANQLKPMEIQTSALVDSIDHEVSGEMTQAVANMGSLQRRILFIVPTTTIFTFFVASFFGWSIARRIIELRMDERVKERTRIARELHDTLLQSFHGLLLRFQAVTCLLPECPAEAKQKLNSAIDQAADAITEGRDAVQGLRSSLVETNDLADAIRTIGEELAAQVALGGTNHNATTFRVQVEGTPRSLHPILRDEVYRIATEALRNACRHAQARQIEAEIHYDERQLRLRVRDDGKGIDPKILSGDPQAGHFGLSGMRERAKLVGGMLTVWSELDSGTEVELSIPAVVAYATSPRRSWLSEKFRVEQ